MEIMEETKQKELFHIYQVGEIPNEEAIKEQLRYYANFGRQLRDELALKNSFPDSIQAKLIHKFIYFMFKRKCMIDLIQISKKEDGDEIVAFCVKGCKILEELFPETSLAFEKRFTDLGLIK